VANRGSATETRSFYLAYPMGRDIMDKAHFAPGGEAGRTGGCLCGAVRYRLLEEPTDPGYCHCRMCQLASGSPAMAFAGIASAAFRIERGEPARRTSSAVGERWFCRDCGTPLAMRVSYSPDTIDIAIATLDQPDTLPPAVHIWRESRIAWFETADTLPRHDRAQPKTMEQCPGLAEGLGAGPRTTASATRP